MHTTPRSSRHPTAGIRYLLPIGQALGLKKKKCVSPSGAQRGVVLLEAVVAIGILGMLVSAVLSLTARSSFAMNSAADRLTATYLAYDAAELIRARKIFNETTTPPPSNWLQNIECSSGDVCGMNTHFPVLNVGDQRLEPCVSNCVLYLNGSTFSHLTTGPESHFRRVITLEKRDLDGGSDYEEAAYTITVYWRTGRGYEESVSTNMTLYRNMNP